MLRCLIGVLLLTPSWLAAQETVPWPPALKGEKHGSVSLKSDLFLEVPAKVQEARKEAGTADFVVAAKAPTVDFAYHGNLGNNAVNRRLWSSWGDICVAKDGKVYCAIGDHGDDKGGDARCFLYVWDPVRKTLEQIVDMNQVVTPKPGQPAWSKVHAKIDEGPDGNIYFCCTLNDGNRASSPDYGFNDQLPGGQIYQYDPKTKKTVVYANLPPRRCTATSLVDAQRGIWWCNLEAGPNALWAFDLKSKKTVFQAPDGSMGFNRAFALGRDGSIYFNGESIVMKSEADPKKPKAKPTEKVIGTPIMKLDAASKKIIATKASVPDSPGMRSASAETKDGHIFGTTYRTGQLYRFTPAKDDLKLLGPDWVKGDYTTVMILSPDERFLYYLPGAHGQASRTGTPVIQYEIASGRRKVIAFLAKAFEEAHGYVPGGTYGAKLSADGGTLYVNFNGHPGDALRPKHIRPNGFGLTSFAAIHIPESER